MARFCIMNMNAQCTGVIIVTTSMLFFISAFDMPCCS